MPLLLPGPARITILMTDRNLTVVGDPIDGWTEVDITLRFNEPATGTFTAPRTAWASAWTFLHINGDELAPDFDVDRAEELMNTVATQELELSEIASALRGFAVAS